MYNEHWLGGYLLMTSLSDDDVIWREIAVELFTCIVSLQGVSLDLKTTKSRSTNL